MEDKLPTVHILASNRNATLYIGVTGNLNRRIWQHRNDVVDGFSKKYRTHKLVYFGQHASMADAILREKQIKKWNRAWKLELTEKINPYWNDLYAAISEVERKDTGFPLSRE
jgi:putative endonuclease